jgi:hypothetical protein
MENSALLVALLLSRIFYVYMDCTALANHLASEDRTRRSQFSGDIQFEGHVFPHVFLANLHTPLALVYIHYT